MKLPSRLATVLGSLLGAALYYSTRLHMSPEAHAAILLGGSLLGTLGIHPTDTITRFLAGEPIQIAPIDGANQTPIAP